MLGSIVSMSKHGGTFRDSQYKIELTLRRAPLIRHILDRGVVGMFGNFGDIKRNMRTVPVRVHTH